MDNNGFIKALRRRDPALVLTAGVKSLLLLFPFGSLIIFTASFRAVFFTVGLATTKRTTNVLAARITGMGQKENSAVAASYQAGTKIILLLYY